MLPSVTNAKSNGRARPSTNVAPVMPSRPTKSGGSTFGTNSLRSNRRGRLMNALSNGNQRTIDADNNPATTTAATTTTTTTGRKGNTSAERMTSFVNQVSSQMFTLQNTSDFDPAWMTERLDQIMDNVSGSQTSASPQKKNPRLKNRTTTLASPSVQKKWANAPNTPLGNQHNQGNYRPNNGGSRMSIESVPPSPTRSNQGKGAAPESMLLDDAATTNNVLDETTSPFAAEVLSLKTGDDVIKFFARHGNECPVRFFYLQRPVGALDGIKIRPYDLEVVMVGQIADSDLEFPPLPFVLEKQECFTMSPKGVVHLEPGHPSEFIVLSTWIRHATIFNVLTSIPFFKSFRLCKLFHVWHASALRKKFLKLQKRMCSTLFLGRESFCTPLLEVSGLLNDVRGIHLIDFKVPSNRTKELTNVGKYQEYQSIKRMEGKKKIEEKIEECHRCVEKVISTVTSTVRSCLKELELEASGELMELEEQESSSSEEEEEDIDSNKHGNATAKQGTQNGPTTSNDGGGGGGGGGPKKKKKKKKQRFKQTTSIAKQKEAHKRRKNALRHAQREHELVVNFVRLVDTYEVVVLAQRSVETTQNMQQELSRDDRLQGLFETSVKFVVNPNNTQTILFEPTVDVVTKSIADLLSLTIGCFDDVSRLLRTRVQSVARRLRDLVRTPMKVKDIVLNIDTVYTSTTKAITGRLQSDYHKASEYCKTFEVVKPIYLFEQNWDFENFKNKANGDLVLIKKGIQSTRAMEKTLINLRVANTIGNITVETRDLKKRLMPMISNIMDDMKKVLVDTARQGKWWVVGGG